LIDVDNDQPIIDRSKELDPIQYSHYNPLIFKASTNEVMREIVGLIGFEIIPVNDSLIVY
jgi:hypothetical protein